MKHGVVRVTFDPHSLRPAWPDVCTLDVLYSTLTERKFNNVTGNSNEKLENPV